jgi:hypothetical protein
MSAIGILQQLALTELLTQQRRRFEERSHCGGEKICDGTAAEHSIALGIFDRADFDNFTATHRDLANPSGISPSQSGYCRTNDRGKKHRNNGGDRDQNKPSPEDCKCTTQHQSR